MVATVSNMEFEHDVDGIRKNPCVRRKPNAHSDGGDGVSFLQEKSFEEGPKPAREAVAPRSMETEQPESEMPAVAGPKSDTKGQAAAHQSEVCALLCCSVS